MSFGPDCFLRILLIFRVQDRIADPRRAVLCKAGEPTRCAERESFRQA